MRKVGEDMKMTDEVRNKLPYIPKEKKESYAWLFTRYTKKKAEMKKIEESEKGIIEGVIRSATLSASVSPYLRAVLMIGESDSHIYFSVIEPSEEKMQKRELAGALMKMDTTALAVREENINFYIKPKGLMTLLSNEIERLNLKNVSLANVHHDYVRYFLGGGILEEEVVFHLLHNSFERLEEVIRKV